MGIMESLASTRAGQSPARSRCSIAPGRGLVNWHNRQPPSLLDMSQYLVRDYTLALPERNLAWTTAFDNSLREEPHVEKFGWLVVRDMKSGLKYLRDRAWPRCFFSQKSKTADLTISLKEVLEGGFWRKVIGWGRRYLISQRNSLGFQKPRF